MNLAFSIGAAMKIDPIDFEVDFSVSRSIDYYCRLSKYTNFINENVKA